MENHCGTKKLTLLELSRIKRRVETSDFKFNLYEALQSPERWNYTFKDESKRLADVHYAKIRRAAERISVMTPPSRKTEMDYGPMDKRKGDTDIIIDFGDIGIENPPNKREIQTDKYDKNAVNMSNLAI